MISPATRPELIYLFNKMENESDELKEELSEGGKAALALCEHLSSMGAASCRIPVMLGGAEFEVSVKVVAWPSTQAIDTEGNLTGT